MQLEPGEGHRLVARGLATTMNEATYDGLRRKTYPRRFGELVAISKPLTLHQRFLSALRIGCIRRTSAHTAMRPAMTQNHPSETIWPSRRTAPTAGTVTAASYRHEISRARRATTYTSQQ